MDNYFDNRDEKNIERIRELMNELPSFAQEFFMGIQLRTSTLTRLNYAYDLRIFFDYLSKNIFKGVAVTEIVLSDLEKLTALNIEMYLDYLSSYMFHDKKYKCAESAKERKLSSLRSFFKYYFKKDKLMSNITTKVDYPKLHDKNIIRLEIDEVSKLLNAVDDGENLSPKEVGYHNKTKTRDAAILTLFLGTGIRISELVGLNVKDIDLESNSFTVTRKGGNKSILYFSDEIRKPLKSYIDEIYSEKEKKTIFGVKIKNDDALFLSLQGNRLTVRAVEKLVKKYSSRVTPLKKITPHKLRSTYGTALYRETQDIYIVADVLGHKDVNTTKRHYAAMSDEIRKNAAKKVVLRDKDDK